MGSIHLTIQVGELLTKAKFYVVNVDTSYQALLGRPWLYQYKMVPICSTMVNKRSLGTCIRSPSRSPTMWTVHSSRLLGRFHLRILVAKKKIRTCPRQLRRLYPTNRRSHHHLRLTLIPNQPGVVPDQNGCRGKRLPRFRPRPG